MLLGELVEGRAPERADLGIGQGNDGVGCGRTEGPADEVAGKDDPERLLAAIDRR